MRHLCSLRSLILALLFVTIGIAPARADSCSQAKQFDQIRHVFIFLDYHSPPADMPELSEEAIGKRITGVLYNLFYSCLGRTQIPIDVVHLATNEMYSPNTLIFHVRIDIDKADYFLKTDKQELIGSFQFFQPKDSDEVNFQSLQNREILFFLFDRTQGLRVQNEIANKAGSYAGKMLGVDMTPKMFDGKGQHMHVR